EKEANAGSPTVERRRTHPVVLVNRPEPEIALQRRVGRVAVERPDARRVLAFTAREHDQRPGGVPLVVFLLPVVHVVEEGPNNGRRVAQGRTQHAIGGDGRLLPLLVGGADAASGVEEERPERKKAVVPAIGRNVAPPVGLGSDILVLVPDQRPGLPAAQRLAVAERKEGPQIIVRHHVLLSRLAVEREHHEEDVVPEQAVFQVPINRKDRRVILVRVRGTLLKIEREQSETVARGFSLRGTAGETEHLEELPPVLLAV